MRRRFLVITGIAVALVLVTVGAVAGVHWWRNRDRSDLQRALAYAPPDTIRFSWTDWAGVRSKLHSKVDATSTVPAVEGFLSAGYDAGLTSSSALVESTPLLQAAYGFSPASVDWELFSQGTAGAVITLGLPSSLSTSDLGVSFASLGYRRPSTPTGVWQGGQSLLGLIQQKGTISPEFQYLALDPDRHLLLASDNGAYLATAVKDLGDSASPGDHGLSAAVAAVGDPLAAEVYTGDFACKSLAMSQADPDDQATADQLVARAGGVNPLDGFAMASEADGEVLVALAFESHDQARHDADSRARLAAGPAPGQGGNFSDRFDLGKVTADGDVVTMRLHPKAGATILSDLSTGPVLFATC